MIDALGREHGISSVPWRDPLRFSRLNRTFHELVCSHCDDGRLSELVQAEWTRLELIRRSGIWYAPGRAVISIAEHDAILDLIEAGADPELIESTACRHELNTLAAVTAYEESLERGIRR